MYRITSIKLHNICQHADLTVKVDKGLTGILAPNGTGKTNLCRGLVYGLTGLVDGLWGNQQTLQKDGTADVGYVNVGFTDDTHNYSIRRFSTSSAKFPDVVVKDGKELCKRRKQVDEFMSSVFGMPCSLMFQVCWGRQGELAQLLTSTPALVSDFLRRVFDMSHLEVVRARIKEAVDTICVPPAGCKEQLAKDTEARKLLPDVGVLEDSLQEASAELEEKSRELASLNAVVLAGMAPEYHEYRLKEAQAVIDRLQAQADEFRAIVGDFTMTVEREEAENSYVARLNSRNDMMEALRVVTDKLGKTSSELVGLKVKQDGLDSERDMIMKCVSSPGNPCPLCGHAIDDWKSFSDKAIRGVSRYQTFDEYDAFYKEQTEGIGKRRMEVELEAEGLKDKMKALDTLIKEADEKLSNRRLEIAYYNLQDCLMSLEAARETLEGVKKDIVAPAGTSERIKELQGRVRELQDLCNGLRSSIADTNARASLLDQYIESGSRAVAEYDKITSVIEVLNSIRDALCASRAQARYVRARVKALNGILARYMAYTELPFNVWLDPDQRAFLYRTPDGYGHPAAHLSGAQRAMASVALQMALYDIMKPNMCLYIIDEPTEPLDNNNKEIMAGMFDRMNRMVASAGGTMLIVTRDQPLIECCNNVLELGND